MKHSDLNNVSFVEKMLILDSSSRSISGSFNTSESISRTVEVIQEKVKSGQLDEAIELLGETHKRLATILSFRLEKIKQDEQDALMSPNQAKTAREQVMTGLLDYLAK